MRVLLMVAATAVIAIGATLHANASDITWSKTVDESGKATDVVTGGTLVGAVTAGRSTTVNGVKFVGQTSSKVVGQILFGSAPIQLDAIQNNYDHFGRRPRNGIRVTGCWWRGEPIPKRRAQRRSR